MTTIRIEGAEELIQRIDDIAKLNRVKAAIALAADFLKGKMADAPTESHRPNPYLRGDSASAKRMRAGFFYHLNHPESSKHIEVPYRRGQSPGSEKLPQSWTAQSSLDGFKAWAGTSVSYARLVQDSAKQTSYHRHTGWITTKQAEMLYGREAIDKVEQALQREVNNG